MRRAAPALVALALILAATTRGAAQTTRLTISGFTGAFGNSTVVIFDTGYDESTAITFVVRNQASTAARTTNVYIRSSSTTIGSHPISDVLWRRNDLVDWTPLSTTLALVESQPLSGAVGTTWTNSVFLRLLYPWASSPDEVLSAPVEFVLEVLPP